jgi:hypothetical protein
MGQINRQTDVLKGDGQADRWIVGLMDSLTKGIKDSQTDRVTNTQID